MNLIEISHKFPDEHTATLHFERKRWGKKPKCAYCKSENLYPKSSDLRYKCKKCMKTFSVTVGTKLEGTKIPLKTWLYAFAIITDAKKGVSALQLQRNLGMSYPTAWAMAHKIRELMEIENDEIILDGVVEMDETYIGGKPRKTPKMLLSNKEKNTLDNQIYDLKRDLHITEGEYKKRYPVIPSKRGRGTKKIKVAGIVERNGNVIAQVMKDIKFSDLKALVEKNVKEDDSVLITDEYTGYSKMSKIIHHIQIDHQKAYSYKGVNTNTIESFWAIIKRGIIGQYHQVSPKHLPKYITEFVFKYNNRNRDDMFDTLVRHALLPTN